MYAFNRLQQQTEDTLNSGPACSMAKQAAISVKTQTEVKSLLQQHFQRSSPESVGCYFALLKLPRRVQCEEVSHLLNRISS